MQAGGAPWSAYFFIDQVYLADTFVGIGFEDVQLLIFVVQSQTQRAGEFRLLECAVFVFGVETAAAEGGEVFLEFVLKFLLESHFLRLFALTDGYRDLAGVGPRGDDGIDAVAFCTDDAGFPVFVVGDSNFDFRRVVTEVLTADDEFRPYTALLGRIAFEHHWLVRIVDGVFVGVVIRAAGHKNGADDKARYI